MEIQLVKGDITMIDVAAIVNAANSSLLGGGGVDGAIHRAAGPELLEECRAISRKQGGCAVGEAVLTKGYKLQAPYIIHTVGPVWQGGNANEATLLQNCYRNVFRIAHEHKIDSLAFPNISTGIYGFPKNLAAELVLQYIDEIASQEALVKKVVFVCFDDENYKLYAKLFQLF
ncbi:O-acetyl-ADP-ribose deacetylase [Treponema sp.]